MKKYFLVVILVIGLVFTVKSQSANLIFSSSWFGWTENEVLGKLVNSEIAEAADIKFYSEKKDEIRFTWRMDSPGFPAHFTYSALTTCYFKNGILYKVEETYRSVDNKKTAITLFFNSQDEYLKDFYSHSQKYTYTRRCKDGELREFISCYNNMKEELNANWTSGVAGRGSLIPDNQKCKAKEIKTEKLETEFSWATSDISSRTQYLISPTKKVTLYMDKEEWKFIHTIEAL